MGYSRHFSDTRIHYAQLYCDGLDIGSACPEHLRESWTDVSTKMKAYFVSFAEGKVAVNDHCFFNLVPERFLLEFFDTKQRITEHVLETYPQPDNYNFLVDLSRSLDAMSQRKLNLDLNVLKSRIAEKRVRDFWKKINRGQAHIRYNVFGTKTGRLTTKKNSFPILTLDSGFRSVVKPSNDWLVEMDFNAAELRTLLALSGNEQPVEDIHEWNMSNVFSDVAVREDAKKKIFSWLYNPKALNKNAESVYNRGSVVEKYYNEGRVKTIFGREIQADAHHALNYIIQSTTSDLFLRQMCKVDKLLQDRKSSLAFCIHDSLVLDMAEEDRDLLPEILKTFAATELGEYKINVSAGKDFGNMQRLKWTQ